MMSDFGGLHSNLKKLDPKRISNNILDNNNIKSSSFIYH